MNKTNNFKRSFIIAVFLISALFLFILIAPAQAESQAPAVYVKDLQLEKESYDLTKDEITIKGTYTVWSQEETNYVPGIMVQVELYEGSEFMNLNLLDVQVEPAVFSLGPQEERTQSFSYQLSPLLNDGKYTLRIQPVNQKGTFLGWQDKVIDIKGNNQFFEMPAESIFVVLKGQENMAGLGVPFNADETPKIKFNISNPSQNTITAVPKIVIHKRRLNMEKVQELTKETITISPGEIKTIIYDMPQLSEPESYLAAVKFYKDNQLASNMALFRWVVRGSGAEILGAKLNQDFYQKGEIANVRIEYVGPADFSSIREAVLNVKIYDKKNNLCGEFSEDKIDLMSYSIARTAEVNISRDCLDPRAQIEILKDGKSLDKYEAKVESTSAKAKEYQEAQQKAQQRKILIFALLIIVLILLIWFIFKYFKNKKMPKTLIFFFIIFGIGFVFPFIAFATPGTPAAPTVTGVTVSSISLSWGEPTNCTFPCGYQIKRNDIDWFYPGTAKTWTNTVLSCGTAYSYQVRGCASNDGNQCGTLSSSVSGTTSACPVYYNLYVNKLGTGSGTVTSAPAGISCGTDCQESYTSGTSVTLTATAAPGSTFVSWSGCTPSGNTCTATMTAAKTAYATFNLVAATYNLIVYKLGTGSGTVTSNPAGINCGTDCQESYTSGTSVTLTATAAPGSTFVSWSGCTPSGNTCTVTMSAFKDVYATFNSTTYYTLSVSKSGTGSGTVTSVPTGINCGTDCQESYTSGTSVGLAAIAAPGSTFVSWSGCDSVDFGTCNVTVNANKTVTATFNISITSTGLTVNRNTVDVGKPVSVTTSISGTPNATFNYTLKCYDGAGTPDVNYWSGTGLAIEADGTNSSTVTCTYTAASSYTITFTVTPSGGSEITKTQLINVAPLSITNFVADPSGGPAPLNPTISGTAGYPNAETFSIDCGNGGASPDVTGNTVFPGPTFSGSCTYSAAGNYTVTAKVMKPDWNNVSKTLVVNVSSGGFGIGFSPLVVSGTPSIVGIYVYPGQGISAASQLSVTSCTNMFSEGKVTFYMGGSAIGLPQGFTTGETCPPGTGTCQHIGNTQNVSVGPFNATIPTNIAGSFELKLVAEASIYVDDAWGIDATWCSNNGGTWGDYVASNPGNECLMTGLTTSTSYNVNVKAPDAQLGIAPSPTGPWTLSWNSPNSISVPYGSSVYLRAETWAATRCVASDGWSGTWDASCSWPGCGGCTYGTVYQTINNIISSQTFNLAAFNPGAPPNLTENVSVSVNIASPTVDLKANNSDGPITILSGDSATLSWTSANVDSCTGCVGALCTNNPIEPWPGPKSTSGSESTGGLTSSKTYTLTCTGPGGSASDSVTVNVGASPPSAPSGLSASAVSCSQINLSWTDNSNNETGFKIERKTGVGGAWSEIVTVGANVTTYPNTGLTQNTTYYYRVRAYNTAGDSSYSNEANATTPACVTIPTAPSSLSASAASCSQINLSWTDNSNNETGFKIERKTGVGGAWSEIATVGANVTTYQNTGLTQNTAYYYRVRAYNTAGDSAYSNEANATTPVCVGNQAPVAVATISKDGSSYSDSITVTQGVATSIYLSANHSNSGVINNGSSDPNGWTDATNGVSSGGRCGWNSNLDQNISLPWGDRVDQTIFNPASPSACNISLGNLTFNDTPGTYTYQVLRIRDKPGLSSNIDTISVTVQAASEITCSRCSTNNKYAWAQWTSGPDGVCDTADECYVINPACLIYTCDCSCTAGSDTTWDPSCVSSCTAPPPPSGLTATVASCSQINLSWTDNSNNETGFKIERKTGMAGSWSQIATVGANTTTYSNNTGLSQSTQYYYRVRAYNVSGDSAYSNEANATTPSCPSDFSLSASPSYNRIDRDDQTGKSYTITVNSISGFSSLVNLSVSGLPAGATAAFVPSVVTPPANGSVNSILTIKTNNTPIGSYTLTVNGTAGPKTRQIPITLNVAITPWWKDIIPW